ncbi:helix-turn-helix domain-containing protein [Blastomonas fulva]|uniref:helix-turn-helix domain-containing protein n=1 Tax=Blastomonas fulva TaxID=1550728 RepID=UPI003F6FAC90
MLTKPNLQPRKVNVRYRPANPAMLTRAEAAGYIGVSISALAQWACNGRGPVRCVIGRSSYYQLSDLDAWIASRRGLRRGA